MDFGSRLDCLSGRLFSLIIRYGRWRVCAELGCFKTRTHRSIDRAGCSREVARFPPAAPCRRQRPPCQLVFRGGGRLPGGGSRQRFAGRLGGKAEFPCGLTGGGGGRGASAGWARCGRGIGCFVVGLMGVGSLLL